MIDPDELGLDDERVPLANRQAWRAYLGMAPTPAGAVDPLCVPSAAYVHLVLPALCIVAVLSIAIYLYTN